MTDVDGGPPPIVGARVAAFFRQHPVLFLVALTPGIPEYLSGSTGVYPLVTAPLDFAIALGINVAMYGTGVLLVREAWIRWGGGWGRLLLLGTAYGLLEEGTALSTLFNPHAPVVGALGSYGRLVGVNWVWTIGVLGVHIVYSVGLPIVLLGLALPGTRGRPLLSRRGIALAAGLYATILGLLVLVVHFYPVEPLGLLGAAGVALLAWAIARRLPSGALDPPRERPTRAPAAFFLLGLTFFPILLVVPALGAATGLPAFITAAVELLLSGGLFVAVRASIGRTEHAAPLVLLALGATLPIAVLGLIAQIGLPIVLGVDGVYGLFFVVLWRRYGAAPPPPRAATFPLG